MYHGMLMKRILAALLLVSAATACGGSKGKLVNHVQSPDAIEDQTRIIVHTDRGYQQMRLDRSHRTYLTHGDAYPVAISADGKVLAISNADTDLFVRDLRKTGQAREVVSYRGRLGAAAVSHDGTLLAVTRHADYSKPQSTWAGEEDNSIDIISTESLEIISTIEATESGWTYSNLWFGPAGLIYTSGQPGEVIDPRNGVRKAADSDPPELLRMRNRPRQCGGAEVRLRGWRGDEGLEWSGSDGKTVHLVRVEGRERGFHDYLPTIDSYFFVPSCAYVVFRFYETIYVVDVETKQVARIMNGHAAFLGPDH